MSITGDEKEHVEEGKVQIGREGSAVGSGVGEIERRGMKKLEEVRLG